MDVQLPEDFCRVEQVVLLENPISVSAGKSSRRLFRFHVLLSVPCQEGQVEDKRDPVPIDEEQEGQESVNGGLGDDVGVEAVAEVDGVNVVAGAKSACAWPTRDGERAPRHSPNYARRLFSARRRLTIPDRCT